MVSAKNKDERPAYQDRPASFWIESLAYTSMRQEAREVLVRMGSAAVPVLVEAQKNWNNRVREEAKKVLDHIQAGPLPPA